MGVDIIHLIQSYTCLIDSQLHGILGTIALGIGGGEVVGVCRQSNAHEFGIDMRSACFSMLIFL